MSLKPNDYRTWLVLLIGILTGGSGNPAWATLEGINPYTWGISCDDPEITSGSTLTDAVLELDGIRSSLTSTEVEISLLRNPALGFQKWSFSQTDGPLLTTIPVRTERDRIVLFFSGIDDPQSAKWSVFRRPFVMSLSDGYKMDYSSSVLELMDILGTEKTFGLGFRVKGPGAVEFDRIRLHLSVLPYRPTGEPLMKTYTVIHDEFGSGELGDWTIVDRGTEYAPSAWSQANGQLRQDSNISPSDLEGSLSMLGTYAICRSTEGLEDFQMAVDLRSDDDDAIGVMFRYQDDNNYYRFSWDRQRRVRRLTKCVQGRFTVLSQDAVWYDIGKSYRMAIVTRGTQLAVAIDGTPIFYASDPDLSQGAIGLYCCANQGAVFDNLRIESATARTNRLMDAAGEISMKAGENLKIRVHPSPPIPSAAYWVEPEDPGARVEDGYLVWQPTESQGGLFRIRVLAEAEGGFDSQTAVIRVQTVNRPPRLEPIDNLTVMEGDTLIFSPTATDPDGDSIQYSCFPLPNRATYENNQFRWTPIQGQAGTYPIWIVAFDGTKSAVETTSIRVIANQPPGLATPDPVSVFEGATLRIPIQTSDPEGQAVTLRLENAPTGARIETGTLTWSPEDGQAGVYALTIAASDGYLETTSTITITVARRNLPPVFVEIPDKIYVLGGSEKSIGIVSSDPERDPIDLSSLNLPSFGSFQGDILILRPQSNQGGVYTITLTASDGFNSSSKSIQVRVL